VRFAPHADTLLERLAAEHRDREWVCLVSSDLTIRETSGQAVRKLSSKTFLRDMGGGEQQTPPPGQLSDRLDEQTRSALERLRRGEKD
jgi:predicted RNA-binding protein with PIN domain